jgi:hypothetical protein
LKDIENDWQSIEFVFSSFKGIEDVFWKEYELVKIFSDWRFNYYHFFIEFKSIYWKM